MSYSLFYYHVIFYFLLILITSIFFNRPKYDFVGKDLLIIFFFTSFIATIGWGVLSINDDSSEFYEDVLSGYYDEMSLFEISVNGQNGPLAIYICIRLYQFFGFFKMGNSPMIGVYFNCLLNVISYFYFHKLIIAVEKFENASYNKNLFFLLFFLSGVNMLLGTSHFRDSMQLIIIAFYCYISYRFSTVNKNLIYYLLVSLLVFWCTFWLRVSYTIIPLIILLISFLIRYWKYKLVVITFSILSVLFIFLILSLPNFTVLQEVSSRKEGIIEDAGNTQILFNSNFLIKTLFFPVYFFSYPFPISSFFIVTPRLGDLFRFFNTIYLIIIFPISLVKAFSFAAEYKKRSSVFFLLGIFLICFYAILFSSFEFRHTAPFFPLLFIILSDKTLKINRNFLKIISFIWFIFIFILNLIPFFI